MESKKRTVENLHEQKITVDLRKYFSILQRLLQLRGLPDKIAYLIKDLSWHRTCDSNK